MSRPEFGFGDWPRARCPECGQAVALTKAGTFWNHAEPREMRSSGSRPPGKCRGTGKKAATQ